MKSTGHENLGRKVAWRCRRLSAGLRALPDFLIIGAMKSGTSSLFHHLAQHPHLLPSKKKEVHYFDQDESTFDGSQVTTSWYRSHFPIRATMSPGSMTYEATPKYLCHQSSAKRIAKLIPGARLIIMLRNPSDRAISHYFHTRTNSADPESLHSAMLEDMRRCSTLESSAGATTHHADYTSYVGRGLYLPQIERYMDHFGRQDIHVINSERYFADPGPVLSCLFEFLGVRSDFPITDTTARNVSRRDKRAWPRTRAVLDDYFRPHNERLFEILGTRYDWNDADSSPPGSR
jgi:hypothetical protein